MALNITREALARFCPPPKGGHELRNWNLYADTLVEHGPSLLADHGIDELLELQHFMAQIGHESGGFTVLWEDMRYSAPRIMEIFGVGRHSAGVRPEEVERLAGNAEALAERVYGLGNPRKARELGNREPGDGYRYRGFGPMQITGRRDHERLLSGQTTIYAALYAALVEWNEKNCSEVARRDDIKTITKRINGGYNGLEDRRQRLTKAKRVWPTLPADGRAPVTSMAESTTARAAEAVGMGGGVTTATEVSGAMAKVAQSGNGFSVTEFVLALAQSPTFWIGVFTVAGAVYIWLERRRKLLLHGI